MKKFIEETSVSRVAEKGLKQVVASNAMYFYIPTHFDLHLNNCWGDPTENKHLKGMVALLVGENMLCH